MGNRRWMLRTTIKAKRRRSDIGLGGLTTVSLKKAREAAAKLRSDARTGIDLIGERQKSLRAVPTFAEAARLVHREHQKTWKNKKHGAQ